MNYWKCKSAFLTHLLETEQSLARRNAILIAEGLDPSQDYTLTDDTETCEVRPKLLSMPARVVPDEQVS